MGGVPKSWGKEENYQKLGPKYVIFASLALHPFINIHVSSHKDIHTHTLTTINGKDVFERRQKWKLYVSIYWTFSCLPLYMVSFNAYSNSIR